MKTTGRRAAAWGALFAATAALAQQASVSDAGSQNGALDEIIVTATPETVPGTGIVVPVASAETILHSKATAGRPKDRAVIDSMREALRLAD